jgi:glycosyltransferase involved in cell wall biosynthesis
MRLEITVVICTHNPRQHYLDKVLAALVSQTLPMNQWELLLIDNASDRVLSTEVDLSWHPHTRHIREENLGLTLARLRGIREAQTELIIFVDDDNVLEPTYLEVALQISRNYPFLGAWGGLIRLEFEVPPPAWTKPYWALLAVREFDRDRWSNLLHQNDTVPCGAGMCIRTKVAHHYADSVTHHPLRSKLGRTGSLMLSCEDSDLAFTACDVGLGTGLFVALKLTHLIPASRLEEKYLVKLLEGIMYSGIILQYFRGKLPEPPTSSWLTKLIEFSRYWNISPRKRRFHRAHRRAELLARQEIIKHQEQTLLRSKKPELSMLQN